MITYLEAMPAHVHGLRPHSPVQLSVCLIWRSSLCQPYLGEDTIRLLNLLLISIQFVLSMSSISLLATICSHLACL